MRLFIVIKFPDVQELMDQKDFDKHCFLVIDPVEFGPSAYMCEVTWLKEIGFLEVKS